MFNKTKYCINCSIRQNTVLIGGIKKEIEVRPFLSLLPHFVYSFFTLLTMTTARKSKAWERGQQRPNSTKIKSAKTFLKAFPRTFIPSKYTRYTVVGHGIHITGSTIREKRRPHVQTQLKIDCIQINCVTAHAWAINNQS